MAETIADGKQTKPGALLKAARVKAGISPVELSDRLGISRQRLSDIECDRKPISLEKIIEVSEAIGVDPHEIDSRLASTRKKKG